jgi:hypothetical protein
MMVKIMRSFSSIALMNTLFIRIHIEKSRCHSTSISILRALHPIFLLISLKLLITLSLSCNFTVFLKCFEHIIITSRRM